MILYVEAIRWEMLQLYDGDRDSKHPPEYPFRSVLNDIVSEEVSTGIRRDVYKVISTRNPWNYTLYPKALLNQLLTNERIVCQETDNIVDQLNPERRLKGIREEEKENIKKKTQMMKSQYGLKRQKKAKKNSRF